MPTDCRARVTDENVAGRSQMTPRERLLAVYRGEKPDRVPVLADLSYWHAAHGGGKFVPGRTDGANSDKISQLLELHRQTGAAIHLNLGTFYDERYDDTVRVRSGIDGELFRHRFETPCRHGRRGPLMVRGDS